MNRQEIIASTGCPACNAAAGESCTRKYGKSRRPRKTVHPVRAKIARGDVDGKPLKTDGTADNLYESWEWKEARFAALKACGRRCLCCGWSPGQGGRNHLVVDHIKPVRTHPHLALDRGNHQVLCNDCNMGKSYKYTDDFR